MSASVANLVTLLEKNERVAPGTFASMLPRVVVTTGSAQLLYLVAEDSA